MLSVAGARPVAVVRRRRGGRSSADRPYRRQQGSADTACVVGDPSTLVSLTDDDDETTVGSPLYSQVRAFLTYVRRRQMQMRYGGGGLALCGVVGIALWHGRRFGGLDWVFGVTIALGVGIAYGSFVGGGMLRDVPLLVRGPSCELELATWPYRTSGRSIQKNAVLATLDEIGSTARTRWSSSGLGGSHPESVKLLAARPRSSGG
jgi:hypothetical protein